IMKERLMLIAGGVDKKGVVYALTSILKKFNFNIEDSSMLMLRKTFSMIMLLSSDKKYDKSRFSGEISSFMDKFGMTVDIRTISEKEMNESADKGRVYSISISGADKPGIVNGITEVIFKNNGNIVDLETKSSERVKPHAYYMFMEVCVSNDKAGKKLESALKLKAKKLGVHVTMEKVEEAVL
ncbi:MAG TPA: ACT domain-containing protein, partial [Candidatus Goldiibacteriota bacterium]|nr:ACT domain-containing protein [Candidatus Goldiibacteriota bacterium]